MAPVREAISDALSEISEYRVLRDASLEEAVTEVLSRPVLLENIGELLAKLRIASGLTQQELADQLGWSQPNVARFESESYESHTLRKVLEYAATLGVWLHVQPSMSEDDMPSAAVLEYARDGN